MQSEEIFFPLHAKEKEKDRLVYKSVLLSRMIVEKHISKGLTNSSIKIYFILKLYVITILQRRIPLFNYRHINQKTFDSFYY